METADDALVVLELDQSRVVEVRVADTATAPSFFVAADVVPSARSLADHSAILKVALDAGVVSRQARSKHQIRSDRERHRCLRLRGTTVNRLLKVCWLSVLQRQDGIAGRNMFCFINQWLLLVALLRVSCALHIRSY